MPSFSTGCRGIPKAPEGVAARRTHDYAQEI